MHSWCGHESRNQKHARPDDPDEMLAGFAQKHAATPSYFLTIKPYSSGKVNHFTGDFRIKNAERIDLLDNNCTVYYDNENSIGQFVTILSVNKTREMMGRCAPLFCCGRGLRPFYFGGDP